MFSVLMILSIVHSTSSVDQTHEIEPITKNPGIYYEYIGRTVWKLSEWKIVVHLETEQLLKHHVRMDSLADVMFKCYSFYTIERRNVCHDVIDFRRIEELQKRLTDIQENIREVLSNLRIGRDDTKDNPTSIRAKRMVPLGIVGSLTKTLFGTATLDDVNEIHENINSIIDGERKIVHTNNKQMHLISEKFTHLNEITGNQSQMIREMEKKMDKSWDQLEKSMEMLMYSFHLQDNLEHLIRANEKIFNIISKVLRGEVEVSLLNKELLQEISNDIRRVTNGADFPVPAEHLRPEEVIRLAHVDATHDRNRTIIIIYIPLVDKTLNKLYRMLPLPIVQRTNNKSLGFAYLKPSHDYIVLGSDGKQFVKFNEDMRKKCITARSNLLCDIENPLYDGSQSQDCEFSLLATPREVNLTTCDLHYQHALGSYWKWLETEDSWLYSVNKEETLRVTCIGHDSYSLDVSGTGIIRFARGCVAQGKEVTLVTRRNPKLLTRYLYKVNLNLDMFKIFPRLRSHSEKFSRPSLTHLGDLNIKQQPSLIDMAQELEEMVESQSKMDIINTSSWGTYVALIVIAVAIIVVIVWQLYASMRVRILVKTVADWITPINPTRDMGTTLSRNESTPGMGSSPNQSELSSGIDPNSSQCSPKCPEIKSKGNIANKTKLKNLDPLQQSADTEN